MANYKTGYKVDHDGKGGAKAVTYTYAGKKITGTSTTARAFAGSGLPNVSKGSTYLNTDTGCWYTCTDGGDAKKAKWKYSGCRRIGVPRTGVTGLKLARATDGSLKMTATWSVPDALLPKKAGTGKVGRVATGMRRRWKFDTSDKGKVNITDKEDTGKEEAVALTEDLASFAVGKAKYTRRSFWPYTTKKLLSLTFWINPYNELGGAGKTADGKAEVAKSATYTFKLPRKPSISAMGFDPETGVVSGTITTDPGNDAQERCCTQYEVKVTDTSRAKGQTRVIASSEADTATSRPFSYNAGNYQALTGSQYIRVHARARARGLCGDSEWTGWSSYYVAFPNAAVITGYKVTRRASDGKVVVSVRVNATTEHPTDRVKLQKLVNVPYSRAAAIPGDADWQDTGSVDDGNCQALVADVADLMPDKGKYSWVRVKSWHGSEESLHTYSAACELHELHVDMPSAADDECALTNVRALSEDAAEVVVAYDGKGMGARDDATGTVLEWSDDPDAWTSTEAPKSHEVTWSDASTHPSASAAYYYSQTVKVKGLAAGTTYWFRARRFMEDEDGRRTYGEYGNTLSCTTAALPDGDGGDGAQPAISAVALMAPAVLERGRALELSWTVASTEPQSSWAVLAQGGQVLASGEGAEGACTVPWERIGPYADGGSATVAVRAVAGGEYADSQPATVAVAARPSLSVFASDVGAQPMSFRVESDAQAVDVAWAVRADGCSGDSPSGGYYQAEGDVVSGGSATPAMAAVAWADSLTRARIAARLADARSALAGAQAALGALDPESDGFAEAAQAVADAQAAADGASAELAAGEGSTLYRGEVALPAGLELHHGGGYSVEAVASDPSTLLSSDAASDSFAVAWAHRAPMPSESCSFEPADDEQRSVSITLAAPDGAAATDVYDVYRVTHDGPVLVSRPQGLPLDHETADPYAPFGDAGDYRYRVSCRTADGDEQWSDYHYSADYGVLRFDFAGRHVELPYDVLVSDSFSKDVELRAHMDGSVEGFWNPAVMRRAALSTNVLRIDDPDIAEAVRAMAQHAGPVFVRTPDGSAYEADVQVGEMDVDGPLLACTVDARQVSTSGAYMLPLPQDGDGYASPDAGEVARMDSASVERTDSGLLESGTLECTMAPGQAFGTGYYRVALYARQDGATVREDVATLHCAAARGEVARGRDAVEAVGRSVLYPASVRRLLAGAYAPKGCDGAAYAAGLLRECVACPVEVDGSFRLDANVVFDLGDSYLDAAWAVLRAGGFRMQVDGRGRVRVMALPTVPAAYIGQGELRALVPGVEHELDLSGVPNRYLARDGGSEALAVNDDPASATSIVVRGYFHDEVDESPKPVDGETLAAYARRRLAEASTVGDARSYEREHIPGVLPSSVVRMAVPQAGMEGDFRVTRQSLDLGHGIKVTERAEREVALWRA